MCEQQVAGKLKGLALLGLKSEMNISFALSQKSMLEGVHFFCDLEFGDRLHLLEELTLSKRHCMTGKLYYRAG
jgi:hypothetical protein